MSGNDRDSQMSASAMPQPSASEHSRFLKPRDLITLAMVSHSEERRGTGLDSSEGIAKPGLHASKSN